MIRDLLEKAATWRPHFNKLEPTAPLVKDKIIFVSVKKSYYNKTHQCFQQLVVVRSKDPVVLAVPLNYDL